MRNIPLFGTTVCLGIVSYKQIEQLVTRQDGCFVLFSRGFGTQVCSPVSYVIILVGLFCFMWSLNKSYRVSMAKKDS